MSLAEVQDLLGGEAAAAPQVLTRAMAAAFTAFVVGLVLGPTILRWLQRLRLQEQTDKTASERLAELHKGKQRTPTMGGLLLIPSLLISLLLWGNFDNVYVRLGFLGALGFCFIGIIDDYIKLRYPGRRGLTSMAKMVLQTMVSAALAFAIWRVMRAAGESSEQLLAVAVPFTTWTVNLGVLGGLPFLLLCTLIMVGTSNGVNLADGMDGLAPGCVLIAAGTFAVIAYVVGRHDYAEYLSVLYVRGAQEMVVLASAVAGAVLAFLWFNAYPAQVFLGDTGSLPLGGLLGYMAIVTKQELLLPIVGGVFVLETVSVILQVGSFKLRGKRIFRIAPIHHHFQFGGMHEVKIVVRFWIVAGLFAMLAVASLRFS